MRSLPRISLLSALLVLVATCKSAPETRGESNAEPTRSQPDELAGLRRTDDGEVRYYLSNFKNGAKLEDALDDDGYVFFKGGTATPVAYGGGSGSCVKEPPIPTRYRGVDQLRCAFPDDAAVEVHGYAWPAELDADTDAKALSRRRAKLIQKHLDTSALPSNPAEIEAHGTSQAEKEPSQVENVVGVRVEITECASNCESSRTPQISKKPSPKSDGRNAGGSSEPLTWLHRHERFRPDWEELNTESLGARRLVVYETTFQHHFQDILVVVDDERTLCRGMEFWDLGMYNGVVFFKPGTARPIAYTSAGGCLTEAPFEVRRPARDGGSMFACVFRANDQIILDGYAWDFERNSTSGSKALSRKRLKTVKSRLNRAALPSEVHQSKVHGASRLTAPVNGGRPVPGVVISIGLLDRFDVSRGLQYQQSTTGSWSDARMKSFQKFMARHRNRSFSAVFAEYYMTVMYRTKSGSVVEESSGNPNPSADRPALRAVSDWAEALVDSGCDVSKVGMPGEFLDD